MVRRLKDLEGIDPKTQAARIAHTVGERKRVEILDQAKKANIRILNPGLKKEAEVPAEAPAEPTAPPQPAAKVTTEASTEETPAVTETKEEPTKPMANEKTEKASEK